jgi:two-component system, cell cycle sensor histidine kinase and response regulator CckA
MGGARDGQRSNGLTTLAEYLEGLAQVSPVTLFMFDMLEQKTIYTNHSLADRLGYSAEEVAAHGPGWVQALVHPDDVEAYLSAQSAYFDAPDRTAIHHEFRFRAKNGTDLWLANWSAVVSRSPDGRPRNIVGVSIDVSEKKRAESELTKLEEQLRQSQKLEAIGTMAGGIAHDFNNLLGITLGYVDVLRRKSLDSEAVEALQAVEEATLRASELTRQLLAFARRELVQPQLLDLNLVVQGLTPMLRRLIPESIELTTSFEPELAAIRIDPVQLEQVVMNLVVNARDAMPDGGQLQIETSNAGALDGSGLGGNGASDQSVELVVRDDGIGMDDQTRARIFEPFFTTKEPGRGTGLGLATVYGIVKQNGGSIAVESQAGRGARFSIRFPALEGAPESRLRPTSEKEPDGGDETVLVVEDEPRLRGLVASIIRERGYAVLEAADAGQALALSREFDGTIALLLTDVVMPHMSGRDLVLRLAAARPEMRVLYMSGYTDDHILRSGVHEDTALMLAKPFTSHELARRVREAIDRGQRAGHAALDSVDRGPYG